MKETLFVPIYEFDETINKPQKELIERLITEGWKKIKEVSIMEHRQRIRYDFIMLQKEVSE